MNAMVQEFLQYWDQIKPVLSKDIDTGIRYSKKELPYEEFSNYFDIWYQKEKDPLTFQETLLLLVQEKTEKDTDFYKKAHIDRKLYSAIRYNKDYHPSRDTAISCCFALELDHIGFDALLEKAGYSLTLSNRRDAALIFCIRKGCYDIDIINTFLSEIGEDPL